MKVLMINGSPHPDGNTAQALGVMARRLEDRGVATRTEWIGTHPVQGCVACYKCAEAGRCVFHDELYERVRAALDDADGLVVGSPTYYAGPNGSLCALLDRLFYSSGALLRGKAGAAVAVCRRGGSMTTFERLNKYFQIMSMPMATSNYWNIVFGRRPGDAEFDAEGMQTLRLLADNLAWLLRARNAVEQPQGEAKVMTNFIRRDLRETQQS